MQSSFPRLERFVGWRLKAGKAYSKMGIRTPVPQPTARLESSVLRGLERQPIHGDLDKNV